MTYLQSSMGQYKLDLVKGNRNDVVDYVGIIDSSITIANGVAQGFVTGAVASLSGSNTILPGLVAASSMPFWIWAGFDPNSSPDVERDPGMPYSGQARVTLWTWKIAGEMSSTFFDTTQTYTPGEALTANRNAATTPAKQGLIIPASTNNPVIGYVSPRGVQTSADGWLTIFFYPAWVPGTVLANE
jgi:hypothetical protein